MPRATRRDTLPPLRALHVRAGRLAYAVSGRGLPRILLFNGAGVGVEGWASLYPRIERFGTVFAWNRFGLPGTDAPRRASGHAVIASLRELLHAAQVHPPYVLVGHSLGGLHAQLFARLHAGDVVGVMLLEATHPGDRHLLRGEESQLVQSLAKVTGLAPRAFQANVHAELAAASETVRDLEAAGPFPDVPLRVVTGGRSPPSWLMSPAAVGERRAHQQELARLSPQGRQVIAQRSGHFPQLSEPRLVLDVLRELVANALLRPEPD